MAALAEVRERADPPSVTPTPDNPYGLPAPLQPLNELLSIPGSELCALGPVVGTVVLLAGALGANLPRSTVDAKSIFDGMCSGLPVRTIQTRCAVDAQVGAPLGGLPPPANALPVPTPLGDVAQLAGLVETALGSGAVQAQLLALLECEQIDLRRRGRDRARSRRAARADDGRGRLGGRRGRVGHARRPADPRDQRGADGPGPPPCLS